MLCWHLHREAVIRGCCYCYHWHFFFLSMPIQHIHALQLKAEESMLGPNSDHLQDRCMQRLWCHTPVMSALKCPSLRSALVGTNMGATSQAWGGLSHRYPRLTLDISLHRNRNPECGSESSQAQDEIEDLWWQRHRRWRSGKPQYGFRSPRILRNAGAMASLSPVSATSSKSCKISANSMSAEYICKRGFCKISASDTWKIRSK